MEFQWKVLLYPPQADSTRVRPVLPLSPAYTYKYIPIYIIYIYIYMYILT